MLRRSNDITESEWTKPVCEQLTLLGAYVRVIVASRMNPPGWPDRWVCHPRWHGHLEFKGPDTPTTTLQKLRIKEINKRQPGTAFIVRRVVDSVHGFDGQIEDHYNTVLYLFTSVSMMLDALVRLQELSHEASKE